MSEVLSSRRSHGHVRWFDERLGESPAWIHFTKNTFIDIDPDEDDAEDKSAYRRQRSAPARALGLKATSRMTPLEHDEMVEAARMAVAGTSSWEQTSQVVCWCNREQSFGNTRSSHRGCRSRGPSTGCSSRSGRSSGPSSRKSSVCSKSKRRQSKRHTACPIMLVGGSKPGRPSSRRNSGMSSGISSGPSSRRSSVISSTPGSRRNSGLASGSNSVASSRPGSRHRVSMKKLTSGKSSKKLTSKCASKNEAAEPDSELKSEADSESSETDQSEEEPVARKRRERMSAVVWTRLSERQPEVKVSNRYAALEGDVAACAPHADTRDVSVAVELDQVEQNEDMAMAPVQAVSDAILASETNVDADASEELALNCPGLNLADTELPDTCYKELAENTQGFTSIGLGEKNVEDETVKEELREESHSVCNNGDCARLVGTATLQDDIAEPTRIGEENTLSVQEPIEEPSQLSKQARKKAQKKSRKMATSEASKAEVPVQLENNNSLSCEVDAESASLPKPADNNSDSQAELSQKQSQMLAQLAIRLNEQHIAMHLRACSARRILVATPVNPLTRCCDEMLEVEPGDVIHCEMTDSSGWGFGTIVAPLRLNGKRGCFKCDFMCPIAVEVRSNRDGDTLEFTPGKWSEVAISQNGNTRNRLREKAALNRIRIAQRAWEKKYGK